MKIGDWFKTGKATEWSPNMPVSQQLLIQGIERTVGAEPFLILWGCAAHQRGSGLVEEKVACLRLHPYVISTGF